jgi:hypothetical protein
MVIYLNPEWYFLRNRCPTHPYALFLFFFELPVALAARAPLLPRVQDQVGRIASITINPAEAQVGAGRANGVEIKMWEIPMLGREGRLLSLRLAVRLQREGVMEN